MPVPTRITDFSTTAASNFPTGGEAVGTSLDDYLRGYQATVRSDLASKGSDIASASSTDLGAVAGLMHDITGTTTITGFGTVSAGVWKIIKFEGALTLTHNATSLILPGAANITTADGDIAIMFSEGSGNWRCVSYVKAASIAATLAGTETLTNKTLTSPVLNTGVSGTAVADQTAMEAGSSTSLIVTPGRQHYHPAACKAWIKADTAGNVAASYGVNSISDDGTGIITVTWATAFSSANYCVNLSILAGSDRFAVVNTQLAGSVQCVARNTSAVNADPTNWFVSAFGDL